MATSLELIAQVRHLYGQNLFLDAYEKVRNAWGDSRWFDGADADELLWAGRLAYRLGGTKLRRILMRTAAARFPEHPAVLVDSRWTFRRRRPLLAILEESLARPRLDSGDSELDAQWLIDAAYFWAVVRDFPRAHRLLDQAASEHQADDSWYHSARSHAYLCEDRWDEALQYARLSWQKSPNKPSAASYLVRLLMRLNRLDEAIESLAAAVQGQSYETLQLWAWAQCAKAERSPRPIRMQLATQAYECCRRYEDLTPLRDRFTTQLFAASRFDMAMLAEEPTWMQTQADLLTPPVYRRISQNLREHSQGASLLLDYRAVYQKQDRCLPTSIASIAGTWGRTLDADDLAQAMTYNGTPLWRALSWLRDHDYAAKVFILTRELCAALLTRGIPFVYTFNTSLDNSHATAAVGIDQRAGLLLYHDPSHERFGRILLERLDESEAPLGPWGLAFVPREKAGELDCIADFDAQLGELCQKFWHGMVHKDVQPLGELVEQMERMAPDSPVTQAFRARWLTLTNRLAEGIAALEKLCSRYPVSIELQRMLLSGLHQTRNTARVREFLGQIVHQGRMPGISDVSPWNYPPSSCVARYADLEGLTADGFASSRQLLLQLLERDGSCAVAYHILGDIYMRQGKIRQAALPYQLASLLAHTDEHYARAAFDCLRLLGKETAGLAYLRQRVERLGKLVEGGPAWMTLIAVHEDGGHLDAAVSLVNEALAARPEDAELLVFATRLWIRLGRWNQAKALLDRLEKCGRRSRYLEAAVYYYRFRGRWPTALSLCEEWVSQTTDQVEPHRMLAALLRNRRTIFEVIAAAESWAAERPNDEEYEFIYYDQLRAASQEDRQERFVRARLKRNGQDAWAWRELGQLLIGRAECLDPSQRQPLLEEIQSVIAQAVRLAPREAATLNLQARLAEMQGRWTQSIDLLLGSLRIDPESGFAYARAWENSANLPHAEQVHVLRRLETRLLLSVGPLHHARLLALNVAARLGAEYAKASLDRWRSHRPQDPELIEAYADMLLEYGQGRTDAVLAAAELEKALARYPQNYDLRISLSHAYGKMLEDDRKRKILQEGLQAWPLDSRVRATLAWDLVAREQTDQAIQLLKLGIALNPQDSLSWIQMARVHYHTGDAPRAVKTLKQALKLLPEEVAIRQHLVNYLSERGDTSQALDIVRDGLKLYPQSPVFWHMLAQTMINSPAPYDVREAEAALRKAVEFNHVYYDAADLLAWHYASQYRFEEARKIIQDIVPKLPNAGPAHGRLAWIAWVSGQKRPAVDQLAQTMKTYPDYQWGWWTLMGWLEELNESELTCRMLESVPANVHADPDLTARRLDLLGKARLSEQKLDAIWSRTLADFPRNEDLLLRRFDQLATREQWAQARQTLSQADAFCARSPHVLLRKVRLAAHDGNSALAVETALEIFRNQQRSDLQYTVWQVLIDAHMFTPAVQAILDGIAVGQAFNVTGLCVLLEQPNRVGKLKIDGQTCNSVDMVQWLAERMMNCPWDGNHMVLAAALEELNTANRYYVKAFLRQNREICRQHTRLWQAIGHFLVTDPKPARVRKWISDWRDRQGVEMVAVSYYRLSFGPRPGGLFQRRSAIRSQWQSIYEASRDALNRLPEDKTILMHVAALCEALLALERDQEFEQAMGRYRNLMETADGRYWLPGFYLRENLVPRLCQLADLMRCEDSSQAIAIFRKLSERPRQPIAHAAAVRHLTQRLGLGKRLAVSLDIWARQFVNLSR